MPKNHKHSMGTTERAFWREAFNAAPIALMSIKNLEYPRQDVTAEAAYRADFADAAVAEYRKRITWRSTP